MFDVLMFFARTRHLVQNEIHVRTHSIHLNHVLQRDLC